MAGDWIKMRECLHEDPAVLAIGRELGTRPEHVVGYCHKFWSWASRNMCHGRVTGVSRECIENVLNLPGFCALLERFGWLISGTSEDGIPYVEIPKFERHLSQGAKSRALAAERKRHARVPKMSRCDRDKSVTREEKRRVYTPLPPLGASELLTDTWNAFVEHRKQLRAPLSERATKLLHAKLSGVSEAVAVAALEASIENGWKGVFPDKARAAAKPTLGKLRPIEEINAERRW